MRAARILSTLATIQRLQSETDEVETKAAQGGTPQRLYESLSAFANRSGGGLILLGVDERTGFEATGVGDVQRLQEEIGCMAADQMEPPLRPEFTVVDVAGNTVLAVLVPEVNGPQKPCYYRPAGLQSGSYIRVANTNRRMSDYEVFGYVTSRSQPTFDEEAVEGATSDDLDWALVSEYLSGLRKVRPRAAYLRQSDPAVARQLRIVRSVDGEPRPTLAGLLVFGRYPQAIEPQLVITYVQYYGTDEHEPTPRGERFLDNRKFEGPLPQMIEEAVAYVMASVRKSSLIDGLLRRDIPEYPEEAVREAIVNAVVHRDYGPYARGSYIQVRLLADRIEIQSPGGLYGNVTVDTLDEEQSTRNRLLARLMEDLHYMENRGSGIGAMAVAMRKLNLEPPRFSDKRSSFWVVFRNHTLMGPEAIAWLNGFARMPLNDRQRLALAFLREAERITNGDYRRLNHVDTVVANRELRQMTQAELLEQHGVTRGSYYSLGRLAVSLVERRTSEQVAAVLSFVREHGLVTNSDCQGLLRLTRDQARRLLAALVKSGRLRQEGSRRWTRYTLT